MINVTKLVVGDLDTNCYIVTKQDNDFALVIDPGDNYNGIIAEVNKQGKSVGAVLLTHAHFDHALEVHKFKANNVPVYMGKKEKIIVETSANLGAFYGYDFVEFSADNELIEGLYEICGFKNVRVLDTPGHTIGSVCYIIENYLFSGDTLFNLSFGRYTFPTGNKHVLYNSVQKLYHLDGDYIMLSGHGEDTTLEYERKNNPALEYLK